MGRKLLAAEGGRLEIELPDGLRDDEVVREDAVEFVEAVRAPGLIIFEVVEFARPISPALSASVFLFGAGSGTVGLSIDCSPVCWRNSVRAEPLCLRDCGGGGGIMARALFSEADISISPIEAGMRLGGLRPDGRMACIAWLVLGGVAYTTYLAR